MKKPLAILVSDIHLSHKPPIFRSEEPNWYEAMKRSLYQLRDISIDYAVPIVCAGDIFDKWNSPPELINFAIDNLPFMHTIPGQHDLPNHRLEDVQRSAYYTLMISGKIDDLTTKTFGELVGALWCYPAAWGQEVEFVEKEDECFKLAVVHSYIWKNENTSYPGAPKDKKIGGYNLRGYDAAVFGDNHKGFIDFVPSGGNLMNCGTFMIRKSDERDYKPMVGVLYDNASIEPHYLDTSKDVYLDVDAAQKFEKMESKFGSLVSDLKELDVDPLDFKQAIKYRLDKEDVSSSVRSAVMEALEDG